MATASQKKAPTSSSIRALVDLLVEAERRWAAGPWDNWDEAVLIAWRDAARDRLNEALREIFWMDAGSP